MIQSSELIINPDGTIFHLCMKPEQLADNIILVGDQGRVQLIASFFEKVDCETSNREFKSITGWYNGKRITALSTGIGTDNIDIVLTELDALANIDFATKEIKSQKKSLNIVRVGTSGSISDEIGIGDYVVSSMSIGFDGLLNFYEGFDNVCDFDFEEAFVKHCNLSERLATPYVVGCSPSLFMKLSSQKTFSGVNISAPGFYGPQGRVLRLPLVDPELNKKIETFTFNGAKVTNFEMESSAIYGLSALLGHNALTICLIIADRISGGSMPDYKKSMKDLVKYVIDRL